MVNLLVPTQVTDELLDLKASKLIYIFPFFRFLQCSCMEIIARICYSPYLFIFGWILH